MRETATLAGYFAAHAVWCVADGEGLVPLLAFSRFGELREMTRLDGEDFPEAIKAGRRWLEQNPDGVQRGVLIYDGYVTQASGDKTDALILEAQVYGDEAGTFTMTIPYRNARHADGFMVYRPTFEALSDRNMGIEELSEAFFRGVNQHERAAPVWAAHFNPKL